MGQGGLAVDVLQTHRPLGAPQRPLPPPRLGRPEGLPVQVVEQLGEKERVLQTVTTTKVGLVPGHLSHDEVIHVPR